MQIKGRLQQGWCQIVAPFRHNYLEIQKILAQWPADTHESWKERKHVGLKST